MMYALICAGIFIVCFLAGLFVDVFDGPSGGSRRP